LKVLHVVPSYLPARRYGGPIYSVHGLCKALAQRGHEVAVFTTNVDGPDDSAVPLHQPVELDGVKVWYFPSRLLRRLYWAPGLGRALREQIDTFDVVHLHSVFLWPTWVAARSAHKAGIPYMVAPRGMLVRDLIKRKNRFIKTAWIRCIERRTLAQASGIHITAEIERQELEKFDFDLPPMFYVPNGIEEIDSAAINSKNSDVVPDYPYVLFLGRLHWKKGLDRMIRAWRHVPDITFVIAGNDEENYRQEMEELAQCEGVEDRIKFIGPVHGDDKWQLYKNAKIFVLPSYSENFGNVVLEAMSMGCPVIVTPEVGLSRVVEQNECGIVTSGDPESLAKVIVQLLENPDACKKFGLNAKRIAHDHYSWSTVALSMQQAYQSIQNKHYLL